MNDTTQTTKQQVNFLDFIEAESPKNDKDFEYFAKIFLKKYKFIRVLDTWFVYEDNVWKIASTFKLKELAAFIHPTDVIQNRSEIVSMALSIKKSEKMPPFDKILLEHEIVLNDKILNIFTNEFREIKYSDYLTTVIPHVYDPEAKCPLWIECLNQWLTKEKILVLQEFFGYMLCNRTHFKKCLILFGESGAGKTRPLLIAKYMVGDENTCVIDPKDMENSGIMAQIYGKKLNAKDELGTKSKLEDGFRTVVDGNPISINEKYKPRIMISPNAKHIFTTNILPKLSNDKKSNDANIKRMLIIEFTRKENSIDDENLIEKLQNEIQGIINWSIEGLKRLLTNRKFTEIENIMELLENYKTDNYDDLEFFIKDSPNLEFNSEYEITKDDFSNLFFEYLVPKSTSQVVNNSYTSKWNSVALGRKMTALGFKSFQKNAKGKKIGMYKGLRLKIENQQELEKPKEKPGPKLVQTNF